MKKFICIIFIHFVFIFNSGVHVAFAELSSYDFQMQFWESMRVADLEAIKTLVKNNPKIAAEVLKMWQEGGKSEREQAKLYGQMAMLLNALIKGEDVEMGQKVKPEKKAYVERIRNLEVEAKTAEQSGNLKKALSLSQAALDIAEKENESRDMVIFLNQIARIHEAMVRPEKALPLYKRALKLAREIKETKLELQSLRNVALIHDHLGSKKKALAYLMKALALTLKTGDEGSECEVLLDFGTVYMNSGLNREAMNCFQQALDQARALGYSEAYIHAMVNLSVVYNTIGLPDKALDLLQQAESITKDRRDPEVKAALLDNFGNYYFEMGQYETARSFFKRALTQCNSTGNLKRERMIVNNLGVIEMYLGRYDAAMHYYELAMALIRKVGGLREMAYVLLHMGMIHKNLNQLDQALKLYILALRLFHDEKDISGMSAVMSNIGVIYKRKGDLDKALGCFKEALQYNEATGNQKGRSMILANIAVIHNAKQQTEQALNHFKLALAIDEKTGDQRGAGLALYNIGLSYAKQKQYNKAQAAYEESLEKMESVGADDLIWHTYSGMGLLAAVREQPEAALDFYQKAFEAIEALKTGINEEPAKLSFMHDKMSVYDEALLLLTNYHRKGTSKNYDLKAFNIFERKQGRLFLEALGRIGATNFGEISDELRKTYEDSDRHLKAYQEARNDEYRKARDEMQVSELRRLDQLIADQKNQHKILEERIKRDYPACRTLIHPQPVALKKLQGDVLRKDEMMLVYGAMSDRTLLWAISRESFDFCILDRGINELKDDITKFRQEVIHLSEDKLRGTVIDRTGGTALYDGSALSNRLLPETLARKMRKKRMLYIVPTGPLYRLPFEALKLMQPDGTKRFLVETHAVAYLSSASLLRTLRQNKNKSKYQAPYPLLAFANPVYTTNSDSISENQKNSGFLKTALRKQLGDRFEPLPETELEVQTIKSILQAPETSKPLYLKKAASRSTLLELNEQAFLKNYRYVVFACHSVLPGKVERVRQPSLVLSDPDPKTGDDGFVTMTDVFDLRFNADMIVLAACETGQGGLVLGEGVIGLTRAFMYAGAQSVAVTLWPVESVSTGALNVALFKNLAMGTKRAEALRCAKIDMIQGQAGDRYRHPYFWASLILFGEGSE